MSIDLTRPLVASMGQHDPLDAYITDVQLRATASRLAKPSAGPELKDETSQAKAMIVTSGLATADPLGIGGLLIDAYRVEQLLRQGATVDPQLLEAMLTASLAGLQYYGASGELQLPAGHRLAFRELGLVIGLHAVRLMWGAASQNAAHAYLTDGARSRLRELMEYAAIGEKIESFWRAPEHRQAAAWAEHQDINEVMLATSLVPEGFLVLLTPD